MSIITNAMQATSRCTIGSLRSLKGLQSVQKAALEDHAKKLCGSRTYSKPIQNSTWYMLLSSQVYTNDTGLTQFCCFHIFSGKSHVCMLTNKPGTCGLIFGVSRNIL